MKEEVILVNNNYQKIGIMSKTLAHLKGLLQLASSKFIFNSKNNIL
jgi:isopentenyldiphosphate isomerase